MFTYCNEKQGIYEVGEVSSENCKNSYPYAMAYKRLFDRVVLKLCRLAYSGVYSDSEADEFKQKYTDEPNDSTPITEEQIRSINALAKAKGSDIKAICKYFNVGSLNNMNASDYLKCMAMLNAKGAKNEEVE